MAIRNSKRVRRLSLVLLAVAVLGAGVVAALPWIVGRVIVSALEGAGLKAVAVTVEKAGWSGLTLRDVEVGEDLRVAAVELAYRPTEIFEGGLGPLVISGVRVRGRADGSGLSFGALDALLQRPMAEPGAPPVPPIAIELRDARLELQTPAGVTETAASATIDIGAAGKMAAHGDFVLRSGFANFDGSFSAEADPDGGYRGAILLSEAAVATEAWGGVRVDDVRGELNLTTRPAGPLEIRSTLTLAGAVASPFGELSPGEESGGDGGPEPDDSDDLVSIDVLATLDRASDSNAPVEASASLRTQTPLTWRSLQDDANEVSVGHAEARVEIATRLDGLRAIADAAGISETLASGMGQAVITFRYGGLDIPGVARGAAGDGGVSLLLEDGTLRIAADDGLRFSVAQVDPKAASLASVTLAGADPFANPWEVSLRPREALVVAGREELVSAAGAIAAELVLAGEMLARTEIDAEAIVSADGKLRAINLRRGELQLPGVSYRDGTVSLDGLSVHLAAGGLGDGGAAGSFSLDVDADSAIVGGAVLGGVSARLGGHGITASAKGWSGPIALTLAVDTASLGSLAVRSANLTADLDTNYGGGRLTVAAREEGVFQLKQVARGDGPAIDEITVWLIPGDRPLLSAEFNKGPRAEYRAHLVPEPIAAAMPWGDEGTVPLFLSIARLTLDGEVRWPEPGHSGGISVTGGKFRLPDHELAATGIEARMRLRQDERIETDVEVTEIRHTASLPAFAPLGLTAAITGAFGPATSEVAFEGRLHGVDRPLAVEFTGAHDIAAGRGQVGLSLLPLRFSPGVFEAADVAPAIADLVTGMSGEISLVGDVDWSGDGCSGGFDLDIAGLSMRANGVAFGGVNGIIRVDSLAPLGTPPGQTIKLALIDAGVPFEDSVLRFQLRPGAVLFVESFQGRWAGGTVGASDIALDVREQSLHGVLNVQEIDLEALARLADIEGVSGTGRISGDIPVAFENGQLAIMNGHLTSSPEGGTIRYLPDTVPSALGTGQDQVELVLKALENFQYETLRADINLSADDESIVRVHLAGSSPELYEGRPIDFNLNFTGGLGQILQQNIRGYQFLNDMLDRL